MAKKEKWIRGAVRHPGAVKNAAHKHGKSVLAEAKSEAHSPNKKISARGRLALRFKGKAKKGNIHKKKHHKKVATKG
jgi:hypothetical protein